VAKQLPILRDDGVDSYVERIGQRLAGGDTQRVSASAVPLHVRCRQCERPECVRAPWRSDVYQPRDAAGGEERRRSCRCARARDQPRRAAARDRTSR
jgi:hypothetical protein